MTRRRGIFGTVLFFVGWAGHAVVSYVWQTSAPAPQELLLAVLAVGAMGRVNTAQTLGFLWGLMLDVQGVSLFGCQGWIFAVVGFTVGRLSRQIDGEKLSAQLLIAVLGTMFHLLGLAQVELLFRQGGAVHAPSVGGALTQILMNAAAAPLVFRGVQWLGSFFHSNEDGHVFRA